MGIGGLLISSYNLKPAAREVWMARSIPITNKKAPAGWREPILQARHYA